MAKAFLVLNHSRATGNVRSLLPGLRIGFLQQDVTPAKISGYSQWMDDIHLFNKDQLKEPLHLSFQWQWLGNKSRCCHFKACWDIKCQVVLCALINLFSAERPEADGFWRLWVLTQFPCQKTNNHLVALSSVSSSQCSSLIQLWHLVLLIINSVGI